MGSKEGLISIKDVKYRTSNYVSKGSTTEGKCECTSEIMRLAASSVTMNYYITLLIPIRCCFLTERFASYRCRAVKIILAETGILLFIAKLDWVHAFHS